MALKDIGILFSTCWRMLSTMHSASMDYLTRVLKSILVSALRLWSLVRCLLSMSSLRVLSIGMTKLANSQKLNLMSSSPSNLLMIKRASLESQVTPSLSKPWQSSFAPSLDIEFSAKEANALSRVKSCLSQSATLRSSRALSIAIISLKQFLWSQSRHASASEPWGLYWDAPICIACYIRSSSIRLGDGLRAELRAEIWAPSSYCLLARGDLEKTSGGFILNGDLDLVFLDRGLILTSISSRFYSWAALMALSLRLFVIEVVLCLSWPDRPSIVPY